MLLSLTILSIFKHTDLNASLSFEIRDKPNTYENSYRFSEYEDSIINLLYPPVQIMRQDTTHTIDSVYANSCNANHTMLRTTALPTSIAIDTSREVGAIPMISATSPTGAKTYQVPLEIPPGMAGLQPKLSFSYNSQSGCSNMGMGWSLSGIPVITRGGKNFHIDKQTGGIEMDTSDSFYIDGVRLIKRKTENEYISYESEHGNILAKGYCSDNIIKYFEVFYPNGTSGVFGNQSNNTNNIYYPITSLKDLHSNTINYKYIASYGDAIPLISAITYNSSSILFAYIERDKKSWSYLGGHSFIQSDVLESVQCKIGQIEIKKYELKYTYHNDSPCLQTIDLCADGKYLNPLKFYYGDGNDDSYFSRSKSKTLTYLMSEEDNSNPIRAIKGRFNNLNHNEGIVTYGIRYPYWHVSSKKENSFVNIYDNYNCDEDILVYPDIESELVSPIQSIKTERGFTDILCADLDGSQQDYIIKINNNPRLDRRDELTFKIYKWMPMNILRLIDTRTYYFYKTFIDDSPRVSAQPKFFFSGDFNGDGKAEILSVSANNPFGNGDFKSSCIIFDLLEDKKLYEGHVFDYNVEFLGSKQTDAQTVADFSDKLVIFDYDGDGKSDICHINDNGINVYTFKVLNGVFTPCLIAKDISLKKIDLQKRELLVTDMNGDGLMDLLVSPSSDLYGGTSWEIYNSKGNGYFNKSSFDCCSRNKEASGFLIHDFNNDGKPDLLKYENAFIYAYRTSNNKTDECYDMVERPASITKNPIVIGTDINSYNKNYSQIVCMRNGEITKYSFSKNESKSSLLSCAINSLGVIEQNYYSLMTENEFTPEFCTFGSNAIYPYVNLHARWPLLAKTETFIENERLTSNIYEYSNPIGNYRGKGFCGFESITQIDDLNRRTTKTFNPFSFCVPLSFESPSLKISYDYEIMVKPDGRASVNMIEKTETDKLRRITSIAHIKYDKYGYPIEETTIYSGGRTEKIETSYLHTSSFGEGYCLGLITEKKKCITNGDTAFTEGIKVESYFQGLPIETTTYVNSNETSKTTISYNQQGNPDNISKRIFSSASLTESFKYDGYGRLIQHNDKFGFTNKYSYDAKGNIIRQDDKRGGVTKYTYDAFNREINALHPDSTQSATTYTWDTSSKGNVYAISLEETGNPPTIEIYDAFGRILHSKTMRFDGTYDNIEREYDGHGRIIRERTPQSLAQSNPFNSYKYDIYDRILSYSEGSGKITNYSYEGNSVTETKPSGRKTTMTYDDKLNLISVSDESGITKYTYGADDQLTSVESPTGAATLIEYDEFGRRISLDDPSLGLITYSYDNAGNIETETNGDGCSIKYGFDDFHRLTSKITPEFSTFYSYNETGDLVSVSSDNGTSETYVYDEFGRLSTWLGKSIHNIWLRKELLYHDGRTSSIKYTSRYGVLATEHYHYTNGHMTEGCINNNLSIYKIDKLNFMGLPVQITTGKIERFYGYSSGGMPQTRFSRCGSETLQNLHYSFNQTSHNLNSREDSKYQKSEYFDYDSLERLISYGNNSVSYDANGNIKYKSDVGTFQYENEKKPFAVTSLTIQDISFPTHSQDIAYTSFSRPSLIQENGVSAEFIYNDNNDRVCMILNKDGKQKINKYYLGGNYEVEVNGKTTKEKLYLFGNSYNAASVLVKTRPTIQTIPDSIGLIIPDPIPNPYPYPFPINVNELTEGESATNATGNVAPGFSSKIYHILRDYLGSITHILDSDGNVIQELSYDAWGRMRDPETHIVYSYDNQPELFLGRGYTGHEHLPDFGLINMNARLYDPALGRFLSPDPNIQQPDWSQNLNRYTYAMNNPLSYIDKDGEYFWFIIGAAALIGGVSNVYYHWDTITSGGNGFWNGCGYFLIGAAAGGAGAAVGIGAAVGFGSMLTVTASSYATASAGFISGSMIGMSEGMTEGFLLGWGNSLFEGNSIWGSLLEGLHCSANYGLQSGISAGLTAGVQSSLTDKNFFTGGKDKFSQQTKELERLLSQKSSEQQSTKHLKYSLYYGFDADGEIRYVGITMRKPKIRFEEHLRAKPTEAERRIGLLKSPRADLDYKVQGSRHSLIEARIWEQNQINLYGLQKNGGLLFNKRNEISPKLWHIYGIVP